MSMERRMLVAVVASTAVLFLWMWLFGKPPAPKQAPSATPPASAPAETPASTGSSSPPAAEAPASAPAGEPGTFEAEAAAATEEIRVETDLLDVTFTNRGARVAAWRLKSHVAPDGKPVDLIPEIAARAGLLPFALDLDDAELARRGNEGLYRVERQEEPAQGDLPRAQKLRFTWADDAGLRVEKTLWFRDGSYLVDVQVAATDRGRALPVRIAWGPGFAARDADGSGQFHYKGQAVLFEQARAVRLPKKKVDAERKVPVPGIAWAGLEEQYFAAIVLPGPNAQGDVVLRPVPVGAATPGEKPDTELVVAVPVAAEGAQLFVGPKKFTLLRSLGHRLEEVVWFSDYGLVAWLARGLFLALLWIHDRVVQNYGLAVILLTVSLRVVLFPLNQFSMMSMRKMQTQMQRIQPKINAIRTKYKKKDAETRGKMNQEMMALYQKEGVNPMGGVSGCLPMLAQFPILIAFYDVLISAVELRGAPFFGWIHDLTLKDPFYVTPLLMGITMFIQQKMSTTKTADPQQAQQQKIMMMMPIVFTVMFLSLPAGLVIYWFVNNLLGIAQQWLVNRRIGRLEAATQKV